MLSVTFKDKKPLVKRLRNCLLQILHQLPSFIFQTAQLRFQEGKGIFQWWSWHGKSAWEIVEAIYHLWEIVARIYHPSPGWQKLRTRSPSSGGKVRISTKGRVPNIRYFVAIYAPLRFTLSERSHWNSCTKRSSWRFMWTLLPCSLNYYFPVFIHLSNTNWFYKRKSKNCVLMAGAAKIFKYNVFVAKICKRSLDERFCWTFCGAWKAANFCHPV